MWYTAAIPVAGQQFTNDVAMGLGITSGAAEEAKVQYGSVLLDGIDRNEMLEVATPNGTITAETRKGKVKTWVTLDAAAKWVRSLGMAGAHINLTHWQPGQRELSI